MRKKGGIDKYTNAEIIMCTQTTMKLQQRSRESENTNILLQERSLDCLCWTIKGQGQKNL